MNRDLLISNQTFQVDDFIVDPIAARIFRGSETSKLDARSMSVLVYLATRAGEVVLQSELERAVWGDVIVTPNSTYQAIAQIRRAFGENKRTSRYIETIPRKGYRLIAKVTPSGDGRRDSTPVMEQPIPQPFWRRRPLYLAACAAVIGLIVTGAAMLLRAASSNPPSLVVLPFVDMTRGKTEQALCEGLTEELSVWLAQLTELRVIARTSAYSLSPHMQDIRTIGEILDVTHALEGSVRKEGSSIRVTVQLVETEGGRHLWASTFDRAGNNLLQLQEEIGRAVAEALRVELTPRAIARASTLRTPAGLALYEDYAVARNQIRQRTPQSIQLGIHALQAITQRAPEFALAYAALADAHIAQYYYANASLTQTVSLARPLLDRAIALDVNLPEAYASRGLLLTEQWRLTEGIRDLRRAIALNKNFSEAYLRLGGALHYDGQLIEALAVLDETAALDPIHVRLHTRRCIIFATMRRFDESVQSCSRAAEIDPKDANASWGIALIEYTRGNTDLAIDWYKKALQLAPHRHDLRAQLLHLYLDQGETGEKASAVISDGDSPTLRFARAELALARGDRGTARSILSLIAATPDLDADAALEAARLLLATGDNDDAGALVKHAFHAPDFQRGQLRNAWPAWWGRSDLLTVALIALQKRDSESAIGLVDEVQSWLDVLEAHGSKLHGMHYVRAGALALSGERARALEQLRHAATLGWRSTWWARLDPVLRDLHRTPEFQALMQEIDRSR